MRLQLRVGINTGPVIVGTVGNNLRMDYKAVGHTVNLAARMEQTAAPGTIQLTEQTYKLVTGYFDCDDLGLVSVKGVAEKVRAYRVTGERRGQTRIDVARERGFTRLVGREHELALLHQCFELARGGRGQAVSIIGDAGLGKSRLLYEFARPSPATTTPGSTAAVIPTARRWPMGPSLSCSNSTSRLTPATGTRTSEAKSSEALRHSAPHWQRLHPMWATCWAWTPRRTAGGSGPRDGQAPDL